MESERDVWFRVEDAKGRVVFHKLRTVLCDGHTIRNLQLSVFARLPQRLGVSAASDLAVYSVATAGNTRVKLDPNDAISAHGATPDCPLVVVPADKRPAVEQAFDNEYMGDAAVQFHAYLLRCWRGCDPTSVLPYPYVALVQSAGFGKSRLVKELATLT